MKFEPTLPARIAIDLAKANAVRALRPHLSSAERPAGIVASLFAAFARKGEVEARERAARTYLDAIVRAHIIALVSDQILGPDVDIGAFADDALEVARKCARHPLIEKACIRYREHFVDICRSAYLQEKTVRIRRWEACPIYSPLNYDPEEEQRVRDDWAVIRAKRESEEAAREAELAATNPPEQGSALPQASSAETNPLVWQDIEIVFLSELRVQIVERGERQEPCNHAELGFEDARNGKPTLAWEQLRGFAEDNGILRPVQRTNNEGLGQNSANREHILWDAARSRSLGLEQISKRVQEIRAVFRKRWRITFTEALKCANTTNRKLVASLLRKLTSMHILERCVDGTYRVMAERGTNGTTS